MWEHHFGVPVIQLFNIINLLFLNDEFLHYGVAVESY